MKTLKSLLSLALILAMVLSMSITAFAASKQDVIAAAQEAGVADRYVAKLSNVLISKTPSSAVCDQLIAHIENVSAIIEAHDATLTPDYIKTLDATEQKELVGSLPASVLRKMESELKSAAKKAGVTVIVDYDSVAKLRQGKFSLIVKDSATGGTIIVSPEKPVADTSVDYTTLVVVMGAVLVCALCGAFIVSRKVRN